MSCIDVRHLSKSYGGGVVAVDDITFEVDRGRVFGFLGPNGAGKSTTIKMLTTLIRPTSGSISILGLDAIQNPLQVRHRIGVVLQQPSYEPTLSVEKAFEKYGMMWGVPKRVRRERTETLLEEFDLAGIRGRRNEDLSIGQRRRVQVAREFIHDMDLLFLDEPTVGLDAGARRDLLDYLKAKVDRTGLSIFYTTHILTEAEYLCDEIAIMNRGGLIAVDTPSALQGRLGVEKTIKIHLRRQRYSDIHDLLSGVNGCSRIDFDDNYSATDRRFAPSDDGDVRTITIHSAKSELALLQILKILNEAEVEIEDLSVVPTSLEEIFLEMTGGDGGNRNGGGNDHNDNGTDNSTQDGCQKGRSDMPEGT